MSEQSNDLQSNDSQVPMKVGNRPGFKNQGVIKAAARSAMLEALTAFKGGKVGKRGLIVRAMDELSAALDAKEVENQPLLNAAIRARKDWAVENILKMANAIAKDDKSADALADILKGAANVQINYNTYWQGRGLTPPPGSGDGPG